MLISPCVVFGLSCLTIESVHLHAHAFEHVAVIGSEIEPIDLIASMQRRLRRWACIVPVIRAALGIIACPNHLSNVSDIAVACWASVGHRAFFGLTCPIQVTRPTSPINITTIMALFPSPFAGLRDGIRPILRRDSQFPHNVLQLLELCPRCHRPSP